jgi:hypothetical protein
MALPFDITLRAPVTGSQFNIILSQAATTHTIFVSWICNEEIYPKQKD